MEKYIEFPPIIHEKWIKYLNYNYMNRLLQGFSCPLNIMNLDILEENIEKFKKFYEEKGLTGKIQFAQKSTKSESAIRKALKSRINMDVASEGELIMALSKGFSGDKIVGTGPKNDRFIELGVRHNILFHVDNIEELDEIIRVKKENNLPKVSILLRFSGFKSKSANIIEKNTKFGFKYKDYEKVLEMLATKEYQDNINFKGFAFHLDSNSIAEKAVAINNTFLMIEKCYELGLNPYIMDIGGGYGIKYIEDKDKYDKSILNIKKSILGQIPMITYNNKSFGVVIEKGAIKKNLVHKEYVTPIPGVYNLEKVLDSSLEDFGNRKVLDIIKENLIELYIEPGTAILDQTGIVASKVNFLKELETGDKMIYLDMKSQDVIMGGGEMFLDPVHLISDDEKQKREDAKEGVYVAGNLCMENDLIYSHKIYLDKEVKKGDIFVFINTGAYLMDFYRTDTARQKIANIIAIEKDNIILDKEYF